MSRVLDELQQLADIVRESAGDFEVAHIAEDKLHVACLEAISNGSVDPQAAAWIGLSTRDVKFKRACS